MRPSRCETITHDCQRHGTSTPIAANNAQTVKVVVECKDWHRHKEFLSCIKKIEKATPKNLALYLIVDNYAAHNHEMIKK